MNKLQSTNVFKVNFVEDGLQKNLKGYYVLLKANHTRLPQILLGLFMKTLSQMWTATMKNVM